MRPTDPRLPAPWLPALTGSNCISVTAIYRGNFSRRFTTSEPIDGAVPTTTACAFRSRFYTLCAGRWAMINSSDIALIRHRSGQAISRSKMCGRSCPISKRARISITSTFRPAYIIPSFTLRWSSKAAGSEAMLLKFVKFPISRYSQLDVSPHQIWPNHCLRLAMPTPSVSLASYSPIPIGQRRQKKAKLTISVRASLPIFAGRASAAVRVSNASTILPSGGKALGVRGH